jgi:hypothetical protein
MSDPSRPFETARTRTFRQGNLSEEDKRSISNVETFGCGIIHVERKSCEVGPDWSFTFGIYDTCGQPEVIVVGLPRETAGYVLNEAAKLLREGVNLAEGRCSDIFEKVDCEFRPVDPKWLPPLMGWALWYYGGEKFPVLQAIYPDRENRFPGEPGFDTSYQQPLLQSDAPQTIVEKDFWAAMDDESSLSNWRFSDPPHTRVFLSKAVQTSAEPITYVSHELSDGAWQFLGPSMSGDELPVVSCFHHPVDQDPSLKELADLPLGWCATREKPGEPWKRSELEPEKEEKILPDL